MNFNLAMIAKLIRPRLNLMLVQPCLHHDVIDVVGSELEMWLAGKHGALEAGDALFRKAWWHVGCLRVWIQAILLYI